MERVTEKRGSIFAALFMVVAMMASFLLPAGEVQARVDSSKILYFGKYYLEDRNNQGSFYSMEFNELLDSSMSENDVKAYLNSHYGFDNAHGTMDYSTAYIYRNYGSETINGVTYKTRKVDEVLSPKVMLDYYHGVYYGSSADGDVGFRHYEFDMYCFSNMTDDQVLAMANNRYGSLFLRGLGFQGFQFDSNDHHTLVPVLSNKYCEFSYSYPLVRVENGVHYEKYERHTAFLTDSGISAKSREFEASIQAKVPFTLKWKNHQYGDNLNETFIHDGYPEESYVAIMVNDSTNSKGSNLAEECKNDEATVEVVTKVVPAGTKINVPKSTSKYDNVVFVKGYSDGEDFHMEDIPSDGFVTKSGTTYYVTCLGTPKGSTAKTTKVKSIKLSQTKATMSLNDQVQLTATVLPADATNSFVAWSSSNENVATVTANGLVTCVGAGNCKITATSTDGSKKKAYFNITGPKKASSVSLKPSVKKVAKGDPVTITATVKPTGVIDDSVTWEPLSDNFEFVEQNARSCTIRCTGEGNLKVRAVSVNGSKKSTISITGPKKASSVSLKSDLKKLAKGDEATITATVNPKDAIDKSVTWEAASDNFEFVEKGDTSCKIRCTDSGNIKVRAISVSNSKKKTITITGPKKGSSVSLKADKKLLALNEQAVVTATVNPKDAIDRTVTWKPASENAEIISYDGTTCTVKCKGEGNVKVKATSVSGNKSKTITISGPKPATSVSIKKSSYTLKVGEPVQATATVNPKNVIYNTVEWSSEDPSIATVTQDGVITAVAPGKTYIYAKAYNGKIGKCTVTVK